MLTLDMFALLAVIGSISALDPTATFHYMKYPTIFRRNNVACQVCFGDTAMATNCVGFDKFRCSYAAAIQALELQKEMQKEANDSLAMKVDSMIYDLVFEDSLKDYKECLPLISSYTQCNKENMCTGCKSCDCDERGRWNCSVSQQCTRRPLDVDHRVLQAVIDNLKFGTNPNRHKRSNEVSEPTQPEHIYEELPDWMYEPIEVKFISDTEPRTSTVVKNVSKTATTISTLYDDDNNDLVFGEILDNDDLKHFIKPNERFIRNDDKKDIKQDSQQFFGLLQNVEEDRDGKEANLNGKESLISSNNQQNSYKTTIDNIYDSDIDDQKPSLHYAAFALKRHVRDVNQTATRNETTTKNLTDIKDELEHLVQVLTVLISNGRIEIEHLNYIKEHLLKFIKKYKVNSNGTDAPIKHGNYSHNDHSTHDWKIDMLHFYTNKFRRDMKDMLKDINALQKLKKLGVAPLTGSMSNLKPLLFTITSYYHKINEDSVVNTKKYSLIPPFKNNTKSRNNTSPRNTSLVNLTFNYEPIPQRRQLGPRLFDSYKVILIKRALVRILVIIDNDKLTTSLSTQSPKTKNILNRIIEKQYSNDRPMAAQSFNFKVSDILTNLSNFWENEQHEIAESKPSDRLYTLKLLHLTLSKGIDKLKCALSAMQFRSSRRMDVIDNEVGEDLIANVTKYLDPLDNFVNNFVYPSMQAKQAKLNPRDRNRSKALMLKIKQMVTNIKNRLSKYILEKLKLKSSIFNENATRRANELNEQKFFQVMKVWQNKIETFNARDKRSVHFAKRMKNIIPKYLRGKVNPALDIKRKRDKNKDVAKAKKIKNKDVAKKIKNKTNQVKEDNNKRLSRKNPVNTTNKSTYPKMKLILRHIQH